LAKNNTCRNYKYKTKYFHNVIKLTKLKVDTMIKLGWKYLDIKKWSQEMNSFASVLDWKNSLRGKGNLNLITGIQIWKKSNFIFF